MEWDPACDGAAMRYSRFSSLLKVLDRLREVLGPDGDQYKNKTGQYDSSPPDFLSKAR